MLVSWFYFILIDWGYLPQTVRVYYLDVHKLSLCVIGILQLSD